MLRTTSLSLAATLFLAGAPAAQRTWIVDQKKGPGYDFVAIQPAIDAARHGDIIRVRNRQTNLVVDARITGPDRVAVLILPQLAANEGTSR